jgi:hypothetical protein
MSTQNKNDQTKYDEFIDDSKELNTRAMSDLRNLCHYSCSKISITNILLLIVIIILIVLLFRK